MSSLEILRKQVRETDRQAGSENGIVFFDLSIEQDRERAISLLLTVTCAKQAYTEMLCQRFDASTDELFNTVLARATSAFTEQNSTLILRALQFGVLHDDYRSQLSELFRLSEEHRNKNPIEIETLIETSGRDSLMDGTLVYYSNDQTFHHILKKEEFWRVFTARNYPIVNKETQQKLQNLHVGIAGSSVGGRVALALAAMGVGKITIVDAGEVSAEKIAMGGNTVNDLKKPKATTIQSQINHLNPYIDVRADVNLVTSENIVDLFGSADIIIQSVDDLVAKILVGMFGESNNIPVLAPTDLGLGTVVEHIDRPPFNDKLTVAELQESLRIIAPLFPEDQYRGFVGLAKRIIGEELIPTYVSDAVEQLANEGLLYLPQTAVSALLMAGVTVIMIITWLRTGTMPSLKQFDPSLH